VVHITMIFLWLLFPSLKFQTLSLKLLHKLIMIYLVMEKILRACFYPFLKACSRGKGFIEDQIKIVFSFKNKEPLSKQGCTHQVKCMLMYRFRPLYKGVCRISTFRSFYNLFCLINPEGNSGTLRKSLYKLLFRE